MLKRVLLLTLSLTVSSSYATTQESLKKAQNDFIQKTAKTYHLAPSTVKEILAEAKYVPSIITKMTTPFEQVTWDKYQKHFIHKKRIQAGTKFWHAHEKILSQAEKIYGVDPSVIVAILGIETYYGKYQGSYHVLDALNTLAFHFPQRAKFFRSELACFVDICQKQKLSPTAQLGSYAGAFGMTQFMPTSYQEYAVDFSKNHHIDLSHNTNDAIMSIANFLAHAGWTRAAPVALPVKSNIKISDSTLSEDGIPSFTIKQLAKRGIHPQRPIDTKQLAAVISLRDTDKNEYWMVFPNFHSIMRYNPHFTYAMAVFQLSQAIRAQHDKQNTT